MLYWSSIFIIVNKSCRYLRVIQVCSQGPFADNVRQAMRTIFLHPHKRNAKQNAERNAKQNYGHSARQNTKRNTPPNAQENAQWSARENLRNPRVILLGCILLTSIMPTLLLPATAFARVDAELAESRKCSSQFAYFEKKYNLPKDSLHSISLQETQKRHSKFNIQMVWPWTVNVAGRGYHFNSRDEAIRFTRQKQAEGAQSIDVGCMQINLKYHPDAFGSLEQAFSPRRNIAYGAKFLREKYTSHGDWNIAVGKYHSSTESHSKKYRENVSRLARGMEDYRDKMRHLTYNRRFQTKEGDKRYVVAEESVMPNEIRSKSISTAGANLFRRKEKNSDKGVAVGNMADHHWFRKNSPPSM